MSYRHGKDLDKLMGFPSLQTLSLDSPPEQRTHELPILDLNVLSGWKLKKLRVSGFKYINDFSNVMTLQKLTIHDIWRSQPLSKNVMVSIGKLQLIHLSLQTVRCWDILELKDSLCFRHLRTLLVQSCDPVLLPFERLCPLETLHLHAPSILSYEWCNFVKLHSLTLVSSNIGTEDSFQCLKKLEMLTSLQIYERKTWCLKNDKFKCLPPSVTNLYLSAYMVKKPAEKWNLEGIEHLTNLQSLHLSHFHLFEAYTHVWTHFPHLKDLGLRSCSMSAKFIESWPCIPLLKELHVVSRKGPQEHLNFLSFSRFKSLQKITIINSNFKATFLQEFIFANPHVQIECEELYSGLS